MPNPLDFILPTIRAQRAGRRFLEPDVDHRLHWNEHPFDLPESIREEILERLAARKWSDYTELQPYTVMDRLATFSNISADQLVIVPSSSALIRLILSAVLGNGDHLVVPSPTFLQYQMVAGIQGAQVHVVPLSEEKGFPLPVDELIAAAHQAQAKMVVICAPNNPTGTIYARADVARLAAECGCLLLVDEAYAQFCDSDMTILAAECDNVILARTFSKAFAMAGVRIGYAITSAALAAELNKLVYSFPLNHFAEVAALVMLENPGYIADYTRQIVAERDRLAEAIDDLPGTILFPSGANFLLVRMADGANELVEYLQKEHRLLINNLAPYKELAGCVRISIGTPEQNDLLLGGWRGFLDSA